VTYTEATQFLYSLRRFGWRLGLETVERLLDLVGNPQRRLPSVHIAGTNGKGSTAAMLAAILQAAGYRTALYTSPHLVDFTERIRVDGVPIPEPEVTRLTEELKGICSAHFADHTIPDPSSDRLPHPTFFELTTAMAFLHFARQGVTAAVIEVGLGGRFDATNVILPHVAVVTNISLEHQEYLGRTVAEIAAEKAGIVKPGVPVVTATQGESYEVIRRTAADRVSPLLHVQESHSCTIRTSGLTGQVLDVTGPSRRYAGLHVPLAGRHQAMNVTTAIAAAEVLESRGFRLDESAIRQGLVQTRWPGRLQMVPRSPRILFDGAHNPGATEVLVAFLKEHRQELNRLIMLFGVLQDKDWKAMLAPLGPLADHTILTRPPGDRAADPRDLAGAERYCSKIEAIDDLEAGLARAHSLAGPDDTILITGSLYTVGAALRTLNLPVI
jgi:dihydrofolate synthase/folylpolyglutamate synthase